MNTLAFAAATALLIYGTLSMAQENPPGQVRFEPDQVSFRSVIIDRCQSRKIEAINKANLAIPDTQYRVEGSGAFTVAKRFQRCPDPLEPGQGCSLYIAFCPISVGTHEGTVVFSSGEHERRIPITGRARQAGGR